MSWPYVNRSEVRSHCARGPGRDHGAVAPRRVGRHWAAGTRPGLVGKRPCPAPHQPGQRPKTTARRSRRDTHPPRPDGRKETRKWQETTTMLMRKSAGEGAEFFGPPRADERFMGTAWPRNEKDRAAGRPVPRQRRLRSPGEEIDARQAAAIKELLKWVREHHQQKEHAQQGGQPGPGRRARPAPQPPGGCTR